MLDVEPDWPMAGDWEFGPATAGGSHNGDPANAHTGVNVYGYNLGGDYTDDLPATYLTTRAFDCTNLYNVQLRFERWLGVESNSNFDEATVEVSNDGTTWVVIWRATDTGSAVSDSSWQPQAFDISAIANNEASVYVRWGMGPTDSNLTYPGWNLDDVEVWAVSAFADCNGNGIPDDEDISQGTSEDCNTNGVPDECDIADGTSQDCNLNTVPDECDIAAGTSLDTNENGIPDECEPDSPMAPEPEPGGPSCADAADCTGAYLGADCVAGTCYVLKNRYLSIDPTVNTGAVAYQVEIVEAADYPTAEGRTWWVDAPTCFDWSANVMDPPPNPECQGGDYMGWVSHLTTVPVTRVWTESPLHISDCGVAPAIAYAVRASGDDGATWSDPLAIPTAHDPEGEAQSWGDLTGGPVPGMPGLWLPPEGATTFGDIQATIRSFQRQAQDSGFPPNVWIDVLAEQAVNFVDIQLTVLAFEGRAYTWPEDLISPADCP
jgi:hypothetical protein